jgi:DNA-binding transcriptional LysR family regulator
MPVYNQKFDCGISLKPNRYRIGSMQWDERIGRRFKLRNLHILLAVVQAGSMARAATRLAVSQPAVSKAIAEMEHTLGVPLLDRSPQGVEPTRYGRAIIKRSLAAFDELRQGVKEVEFLSDPTVGEVRIGTTEALAAGLMTAVVERLWHRHPRITTHVVQDDTLALLRELDQRNVELVITRMVEPSVQAHLDAEILYHDPLVVVTGKQNPWARRRKVRLADLASEPWILLPPDTLIGSTMVEAFRASGLEPPPAAVVTQTFGMRNGLLATGHFFAMLAATALKFPTVHPAIKALPIRLPTTRRPVGIITLKNRALSPVAQLFIACTREVATSIAARPQREE